MKRANMFNVPINNHTWPKHYGCATHNVYIISTIDFQKQIPIEGNQIMYYVQI